MPKENKKRGRREERKRKREAEEEVGTNKRVRTFSEEPEEEEPQNEVIAGVEAPPEAPFYGLLDDEEQERFKRADETLERNEFDSPEERQLFLEELYKDMDGYELKIAASQSCSRLMERVISVSTATQLKKLFQKFCGQYVFLAVFWS
jgi:nucleolar protein 9